LEIRFSDDLFPFPSKKQPIKCYNTALIFARIIMKKAPKSFEEALARLETLTQSMQSSEMPLEDALAAYQEGNELVRYCQTKLAEVEQKLQVLDAGELKELNLEPGE
jgi:exodeoxyribonuclease VII, small subunit